MSRLLSVTYRDKLQKAVWHGGLGGETIYAAPLCLCLLNLVLLCLLLTVASAFKPPAGLLGGLGLMLYPYCRLVNDLLRVDRNGMGKTFTFLFLPALFVCGFVSFVAAAPARPGPRTVLDASALGDPRLCVLLAVEYLLLALLYGFGVEFTRKDREPRQADVGETLVAADSRLVEQE
jgi:hypothetical protein